MRDFDRAFLRIENLSKAYGGVQALCGVSLSLLRGEVHALCGENGAGKSTLIKCLTGVVAADAGTIAMDGQPLESLSVRQSEAAGIAVIHQESTAFRDLSAVQNIFVGRERTRLRGLLLDRAAMRREARELLGRLGHPVDLARRVGELSVADRQMIALGRALSRRCRLLITDEATASLSVRETRVLLGVLRRLRREGVTVLYVSHRLEEVFRIADRVTVLRDGQHVATRRTSEIDKGALIKLMVGREASELTARHEHAGAPGQVRLQVQGLGRRGVFHDVNLSLRAGEIVGLAGLVGAGRSELARAIFGIDDYDAGAVLVDGRPLPRGSVEVAMRRGLALVPEDRQHEGLILPLSIGANLTLAVLRQLSTVGLVNRRQERRLVAEAIAQVNVRAAGEDMAAATLSGGNQQKLVLGKWLARRPRVLILDEPTRGVDVAAKSQIHQLIRRQAAAGMSTLLISSELPELLSICDRMLVMRQGRIAGELEGQRATQEAILQLALPEVKEPAPT